MSYRTCIDGFTESRKECTDWRDDGYEKCDQWGQDCVSWAKECVLSWIPFIGPAICKVFEWICRGFQWVCKAAVWVAQWVCHAWNLITTFVCLVWETALLVLAIVGIFVKLIFSIPIIGALVKEIVNAITSIVIGLVGFVIEGVVCGLLGICLPKKMRLCVIISHDDRGQPVAIQATVQPIVDRMKQIYKDETNVTVYDHFDSDARTPNVEPSCGADGWLEDLWLPGSQFENSASLNCREYSFASVIGIGSPIYAFVVKNVKGKNACSLGPLTNYIVFEPGNACAGNTHLAHEVGHACNLLHTSDQTNLMFKGCLPAGRDQLSGFQKSIIRGSKYVTYF